MLTFGKAVPDMAVLIYSYCEPKFALNVSPAVFERVYKPILLTEVSI
ncbi:hypothetical protein IBT54_004207 [Pantoea sp. S62]|nr:hypothetical protein [Pantoea sp. S62]